MAFNGSGSFSRTNGTNSGATTWQLDRDAGTKILASRHDSHDEDIAANGLSYCIVKDGQTTITANLPMAGFKHTNVGNAAARNQYASAAQVQDSSITWGGTSGGSANAQTISPSPAITAYAAGQRFAFKAGFTNTSSTVTLNVNSVGAQNIRKQDGSAAVLALGDLTVNRAVDVMYDGTSFQLLNPLYDFGNVDNSVTAAGTNQGTATALNNPFVKITGGGADTGVILPIARGGMIYTIYNGTTTNKYLYPASGEQIENIGSNNSPVNLLSGETREVMAFASGLWRVVTPYDQNTGLSATGTTQGAALPLRKAFNEITTATGGANDSVILPLPTIGMLVTVINASGATINVFPNTGHAINNNGANNAVTQATQISKIYYATSTTQWYQISAS